MVWSSAFLITASCSKPVTFDCDAKPETGRMKRCRAGERIDTAGLRTLRPEQEPEPARPLPDVFRITGGYALISDRPAAAIRAAKFRRPKLFPCPAAAA